MLNGEADGSGPLTQFHNEDQHKLRGADEEGFKPIHLGPTLTKAGEELSQLCPDRDKEAILGAFTKIAKRSSFDVVVEQ